MLYCYIVTLLTVILNLIQNLLKNDPDFHQDDDEKGILDPVPFDTGLAPVPFDTGLEQARMTREIHCYIVTLLSGKTQRINPPAGGQNDGNNQYLKIWYL